MFRVVLIGFVAAIVVVSAKLSEECTKKMHPHMMRCCKSLPQNQHDDNNMESMKECFGGKLPGPPPSGPPPSGPPPPGPPPCDIDICMAKKKGFLSEDGVIDKKAFQAEVEKDFESNPVLVEMIEKECIHGDVTNYGPEDMCDLRKLHHCVHIQVILSCPDLDNSGRCSGFPEIVEECKKQM